MKDKKEKNIRFLPFYVIFRVFGRYQRPWAFILANDYKEALYELDRAKVENPDSKFYLRKVEVIKWLTKPQTKRE